MDKLTSEPVKPSIPACIVLTAGRLGFTDNSMNVMKTAMDFGLPLAATVSAFWEHGITSAIDRALGTGLEYFLFIDGDGVWSRQDVVDLYSIIASDDNCDAICPVQVSRSRGVPLNYDIGKEAGGRFSYDYEGETTPIWQGHFGLTFIRSSVFRQMTRPWFVSLPGPGGSWEKGKIDADIYFWYRLYRMHKYGPRTGHYMLQANRVIIGHMDLHIRWPTKDGVIVQSRWDYWKNGRPKDAACPKSGRLPRDYLDPPVALHDAGERPVPFSVEEMLTAAMENTTGVKVAG